MEQNKLIAQPKDDADIAFNTNRNFLSVDKNVTFSLFQSFGEIGGGEVKNENKLS